MVSSDVWLFVYPQPRGLIPGLYEAYIPQALIMTESDTLAISMQPVGPNRGKPSIIVDVSRANGGGIIRIYQIYNKDRTPYTGTVKGLAMAADNLWTSDDAYDEYVERPTVCLGRFVNV